VDRKSKKKQKELPIFEMPFFTSLTDERALKRFRHCTLKFGGIAKMA
jgi:hypothetical protein